MRKTYFLLLLISVILLNGCKPSRPSNVMSESKMEKVLVDYHLAQGMASLSDKTAEKDRYKFIHGVFQKHGITEAEFDTSLVYYSVNSEKLDKIYNRVLIKIQTQAEKMGVDAKTTKNRFANLTAQGDTANIWTDKSTATILRNKTANLYQFYLHADTTYRAGDSFIWHFSSQVVTNGAYDEATAQLIFTYDNDSVISRSVQIRGNSTQDIRFSPTTAMDSIPLRSVSGFVYISPKNKDDKHFQILLLTDLSLIRMHRKIEEKTSTPGDSIATDSLTVEPPLHEVDSAEAEITNTDHIRLSPTQKRDAQPKEQRIRIRKESNIHQQSRVGNRATRGVVKRRP